MRASLASSVARLRAAWSGLPLRERRLLIGICALGLAIRLAYVLADRSGEFVSCVHVPGSDEPLCGDEPEYDLEGRQFLEGHWWWSDAPDPPGPPDRPLGASVYKAPVYPLWVGAVYRVLGADPDRVFMVQALLGVVTILLAWALARRLFGAAAGLATAAIVAIHPFAWQWEGALAIEALAVPMTLAVLLLVLERPPTERLALGAGGACAVLLLTRPSSAWVPVGVAAAFLVATGWRRGARLTALAALAGVLALAPWTIRNYVVTDELVPISIQYAALYGVFNDAAANDPFFPWAWRPNNPRDDPLFLADPPLEQAELGRRLRANAFDYIRDNPLSVPAAFVWNGRRLWDLRRPSAALHEVQFEGRSRTLTKIGLAIWWIVLPLALAGLWRHRRRTGVVIPLLAMAVAATVVHTTDAGTRYRAPFEPLAAMMACAVFVRPTDERARVSGQT